MADTKKVPVRRYEVLVSFSGLDKGDHFTMDDEGGQAWARQFVETGYLLDVTEAPDAGEVGKG